MSPRFHRTARAAFIVAMLTLASQASAQSQDVDPEMRIQQLENQLRQLTGQNEELQYRNRQLEDRLRLLQGGAQAAPGTARRHSSPMSQRRRRCSSIRPIGSPAMTRRLPRRPRSCRSRAAWRSHLAAAAATPSTPPRIRTPRACPMRSVAVRNRFRPSRPSARRAGAARASRSISPIPAARTTRCRAAPPPRDPGPSGLTTLPPSATPKDEFDLGIGYMQRKDYALAEETMRNFAQKYPSDPLTARRPILARRELLPAPAISRCRRSLPRGDHQIRQIGEGAGCPAAARAIAGGAEGEGGRLCRLRRGDAEISARLQRRQGGGRPRAEAGEVLGRARPGAAL